MDNDAVLNSSPEKVHERAVDAACEERDCEPETACVEDHCCQDTTCEATDRCAEDECHPAQGNASVDDNASIRSKVTTCCGSVERCDEKCIYSAAAFECAKACDNNGHSDDHTPHGRDEHPHEHDESGKHPEVACASHIRTAFDQYASYIEQARCICRNVMSQSLLSSSTCCKTASTKRAVSSGTENQKSAEPHSLTTGYSRPGHHHHPRGRHYHHNHQHGGASGAIRRRVKDLSPQKVDDIKKSVAHEHQACYHGDDHQHTGEDDCGHEHNQEAESCCIASGSAYAAQKHGQGDIPRTYSDMEKLAHHETVSVAITGMDCTSCGDKLARVLLNTNGVSQARVNFIAGRADFTINNTLTDADQAVRNAASGSGFRLIRMVGGDYYLDITVSRQTATEMTQEPPPGVFDVHVMDKNTIRLTYDPAVKGARDLYHSISDRTQGLAQPQADPQLESSRRRLWDQAMKTLLAAIFTVPVVTLSWGEDLTDKKTKAIVSVTLGIMVQCIAVPEFYRPALSTLFYSRVVEMDMLVVISITAAFVYSVIAFGFQMADAPLETSEFFETSTLLITLILLGRLIATFARVRAMAAVSVRSLQSNTALVVEKGKDREIDARLLQYGDQFKLLPHTRAPTDGTILKGTTEVDESMLTGEAMPVLKNPGDTVIAGTINGDGTVLVQLDRLPGKNTVTDIAQLVDEAAESKPRIQDLADKIAGWFVPVVSIISVTVFATWAAVGIEVLSNSTSKAILEAVTYFVATLAVACPCALGLAVPMVLVVAGGIAARGGVIIKTAETTERARKATDIVFDKTGTITESELVVAEQRYLTEEHDQTASLVKALVAGGKHPVSAAVSTHLSIAFHTTKVSTDVTNVRVVPGAGIQAELCGRTLRAGHPRWTETTSHPVVQGLQESGHTILVVVLADIPVAVFGLRSQIKPDAIRVITQLQSRNITVHLVSGDQSLSVASVAESVGIVPENVAAERTPSQKRDYVASIMEDPRRYVIFCGDGTNDAVAIAQANVGVQIGGSLTSSDVTQAATDAILLNGLDGIIFLLNVSKASFNRMAFNFIWSAIYNALAITMASGAWVEFRIPPAYAGLGEFISVLPVILASMTLFVIDPK